MAALVAGAVLPANAANPADKASSSSPVAGEVPASLPTGQKIGSHSLLANANLPETAKAPGGEGIESVVPYKLIRSLQFVQDAVVKGDHSAMEMQRYLLEIIDKRLRAADQRVFDDPRNVDAALIYAMSGGNPETLELLALQDKFGNFDNEVTSVLRAYLDGRAAKTETTLEELVGIYRNSEIGPYLALIAANVTAGLNDVSSLEMFDWARLTAPGTLVEEAALRRSLFIATRKGLVDRALAYANLYARRFINSPYAGQFADLLVDLVEGHFKDIGEEKLEEVLAFMDRPRQREVYLRISRRAAINARKDLALLAAAKAQSLADIADLAPAMLADLYSSLVDVSSGKVAEASRALAAVREETLSTRDAALRDAARLIAAQVMRAPDPDSLTQALQPRMAGSLDKISSKPGEETEEPFRSYVDRQEKTLQKIDDLLAGRDGAEGS